MSATDRWHMGTEGRLFLKGDKFYVERTDGTVRRMCDYGCDELGLTHGLCQMHASRKARGGRAMNAPKHVPILIASRSPICEVPDCNRPRKVKGFCKGHYNRHTLGLPMEDQPCAYCGKMPRALRKWHKGVCPECGIPIQKAREAAARQAKHDAIPPQFCIWPGCGDELLPKRRKKRKYPVCRAAHGRIREKFRKYKISAEEFVALIELQGGHCAICPEPWEVVDHDHLTGKVRGLLCQLCNRGLGQYGDDPELLMRAAAYLGLWPTNHADA